MPPSTLVLKYSLRLTAGGALERRRGATCGRGGGGTMAAVESVGGPGLHEEVCSWWSSNTRTEDPRSALCVGWILEAGLHPEVQEHKGAPENAEESVDKHPPWEGIQLSFPGMVRDSPHPTFSSSWT